jgi:hypothetical protein
LMEDLSVWVAKHHRKRPRCRPRNFRSR